ncbi:sialidase-3-like [Anneissia japonica]|uniref:sialidase-3-like n=1 Tax=Anneissia japonica TaxID=1529436 RepID=UPI00142594DD|nr:sialidase-3-like [Anneissia japonica]
MGNTNTKETKRKSRSASKAAAPKSPVQKIQAQQEVQESAKPNVGDSSSQKPQSTKTVFESSQDTKPTYRIPALVFHENYFLAFCEKRFDGHWDIGKMDLVLRRGHLGDDGVKWEPEVTLYPENDTDKLMRPMNPVPIVVGEGHIILMFNTFPKDTPEKVIKATPTPPGKLPLWQLLIKHSTDGGKTWKNYQQLPVGDIFSGFNSVPSTCAVGPGHGIKLESGRLVVTGNIAWKGEDNRPFAIVSDDNGDTWKMGGEINLPELNGNSVTGNECQAVEVAHNYVVVNCRTLGTHPRIQCYSSDGCDTFGSPDSPKVMRALKGPKHGCQGSILGFSAPLVEKETNDKKYWALLSNPHSDKREKLSVLLSRDGCKTWPYQPVVLEHKGSAYSDLTGFTQDGQQKFACLFERIHANNKHDINFVIFTIDFENLK